MAEWEMGHGTCVYEVDLHLASDSGREKHVDVREQGAWLLLGFDKALRSVDMTGTMVTEIRYLHNDELVQRHVPKAGVEPFQEDLY